MRAAALILACLFLACAALSAPHIPPPGIAIPEADRQELTAGAAALRKEIDALNQEMATKSSLLARTLMPDIEIYHKAVDWALRYDEFFDPKQVAFAKTLLQQGGERVSQLRAGRALWLDSTGLVVRAYRSALDGSVQPYGLVVPATWNPSDHKPSRLLVWLAGRNEKRTELAFLKERESSTGPFTPEDTIVLHPYGRFCNATKFAGEVDVFEAMKAVCNQYSIDSNRIAVAGFSMGGASAWHLATHYSGLWCAASPGAGFAETAKFAKISSKKEQPPWWEQKLWHWYDATDYAANLFNCPTIAYSGEIDPQKQSADVMEKAMAAEGLKLERFIGPQTAHQYEPETRKKLAERLEELMAVGRFRLSNEVHLTTYTLHYPWADWIQILGMEHQWERADVRAVVDASRMATVTTANVTKLQLWRGDLHYVTIDGIKLKVPERTIPAFRKEGRAWRLFQPTFPSGTKEPTLVGPIDDVFMGFPFLFVRPTGKPLNDRVGKWAEDELVHATKMWRDVFRADAPVKDDTALTREDFRNNLILWGDPSSNKLLAKILDRLPLKWTARKLIFNGQTYDAGHHVPILIFPNPEVPSRYIVLNSGIDFRDDAYGSNALQTPKLPDWAIVDLDTPPGPRWPGRIAEAGFFDEVWQLPAGK